MGRKMLAMADKEWAKKNPEKHAANQRAWSARNREKASAIKKKWREENPERHREIQRQSAVRSRLKARLEMIEAYGGKCSCCGEDNHMFLSIEHIGGMNGRPRIAARDEIRRLKAAGWPADCTCLCFNCNLGSWRNGGVCPHQLLEIEP